MKRSPMKRRWRDTGPDHDTLAAVVTRCGGRCEICGNPGTQTHHRVPRGAGGTRDPRINQPSNLLRVCHVCHEYVERNRGEALIAGWLVSRWSDPATVPVLINNGERYVNLSDDGRYLNPDEVAL